MIRELGMHVWYAVTLHILVRAVSVEPVAAATSFARKGSIPEGFCPEGVEGTGRLGVHGAEGSASVGILSDNFRQGRTLKMPHGRI